MSLQAYPNVQNWTVASNTQSATRIRLFFAFLAALCAIGPVLQLANGLFADPDSQWHLKVGLDMLANRAFPVVDTYSYTFAGEPWIAKEWLGQVMMALAYQAAGWNGIAILMASAIGLTAFALAWFISASIRPMIAFALALVMIVGLVPILNARPYLLTFPLLVIWTACLFDAARKGNAPSFWLLPLMCLWSNIHSGFTLGFIIAACAFVEFAVATRLGKRRELGVWVLFGVLTLAVTLIHPYGYKALLATVWLANGNEAVDLIMEWNAFDLKESPVHAAIILAAFFGLLVSGIRFSVGVSLLTVFAFYSMFAHVRFIYLPFLAVPVVLAYGVAQYLPAISTRQWAQDGRDAIEQFLSARFPPITAVLAAAMIFTFAMFASRATLQPDPEVAAPGAIAYAKTHGLDGNVLNSYNLGGALILNGIKTYIDGRTDQLFLGGFTLADDATKKGKGLDEILARHDISWAILATKDLRIPMFDAKPGWKRVFSDADASIYVRTP